MELIIYYEIPGTPVDHGTHIKTPAPKTAALPLTFGTSMIYVNSITFIPRPGEILEIDGIPRQKVSSVIHNFSKKTIELHCTLTV